MTVSVRRVSKVLRSIALAVLAGAGLVIAATIAHASDRTVFVGCVAERADATTRLGTSGGEIIIIDTSRLNPGMADALTADCPTITSLIVGGRYVADGRYIAKSVEAGDEPNGVHSLTNETTHDRT
jgi:hypothetical protein